MTDSHYPNNDDKKVVGYHHLSKFIIYLSKFIYHHLSKDLMTDSHYPNNDDKKVVGYH